jgi:ubiquinone biosynthesis monooxygenase Coq6
LVLIFNLIPYSDIGAWKYINETRVQPYFGMEVWDGLTNSNISFDWNQTGHIFGYQNLTALKSNPIAYMIENTNLTTGLQKYLTKLGGVTIVSPARVESITYGPSTESLDLTSWPKVNLANGQSLVARLLVGADGANSPVRTFAGIQSRGWDYGRFGVVATLRLASTPRRKIAFQRFLPTGPIAMLPFPGNFASLVWSTTPERAAVLKSLKTEDFVAMVNSAFRLSVADLDYLHSLETGQTKESEWRERQDSFTGELPERVVGVQEQSVAAFPLKFRHADTYTAERVALVGLVLQYHLLSTLIILGTLLILYILWLAKDSIKVKETL